MDEAGGTGRRQTNSNDARPIIVCGPARAGTTAVQGLLCCHPEILIHREVLLERLPSLKPLIGEIAEHQREQWGDARAAEVIRALWFAAARPSPEKPDARRWGMKTPWSELDADFWDSLIDPAYVYALRRGDRVFQSHVRLGWNTGSPAKLLDLYKRSIRAFERLSKRGRAHMVQLDLAEDPAGRRRVAEALFAFLREDPGEAILRAIENYSERINRPTSRRGEEPELPDEWQELLTADDEYRSLMATYGY
jgi:hypothetical protein